MLYLDEDGVDFSHLEVRQDGRFMEASVDVDADDFKFR
jgi:hypothetical protein